MIIKFNRLSVTFCKCFMSKSVNQTITFRSSKVLIRKLSLRTHTLCNLKMSSTKTRSIFEGRGDRFKGVTVHSNQECCDGEEFAMKLKESLKQWSSDEKRGIWFKVYLEQSDWIPLLVKEGFKFHHAKNDYVMMYKWLPKEVCNIPPYASTLLGVGAVIVNEKSQILVVSEKNIERPHWKLPGGYIEPGEDIIDAAKREVLEETNIVTEFKSILTLRHTHHGMFGCSDIYIVVSLKPLSEEIKKSEQEISRCSWMDLSEYLSHPHIHSLNKFFVKKYMDHEKDGLKVECTDGVHDVLKVPYKVYHVTKQ